MFMRRSLSSTVVKSSMTLATWSSASDCPEAAESEESDCPIEARAGAWGAGDPVLRRAARGVLHETDELCIVDELRADPERGDGGLREDDELRKDDELRRVILLVVVATNFFPW